MQNDDPHETVVPHNHEASQADVEASKAKAQMRTQIQATKARPGQVLAGTMMRLSDEAKVEVGRVDSVKRNLRRSLSRYFLYICIFRNG